jgi:hypothetical protein
MYNRHTLSKFSLNDSSISCTVEEMEKYTISGNLRENLKGQFIIVY